MQLDWGIIVGIAGAIGGVVGAGLKTLWDHVLRNRNAERERKHALAEVSRNELKQAYADLLAACSEEFEIGKAVSRNHSDTKNSRAKLDAARAEDNGKKHQADRVDELAGYYEEDLVEGLALNKTYKAQLAKVQLLASRILLIEPDAEFLLLVGALHDAPSTLPPRTGSDDEFLHLLLSKRAQVVSLTARLGSRFAPSSWHRPQPPNAASVAALLAQYKSPALPAPSSQQLPAPSSPTLPAAASETDE